MPSVSKRLGPRACNLAVVALVGLVAGCSSDSQRPDAGDATPPIATPAIDREISRRLPVGLNWRQTLSFLPTTDDNRSMYLAWQSRIGVCMEARGFVYIPIEYVDDSVVDFVSPLDEAYAHQYGYHLPQPNIVDTNHDDSPGFARALEGTAEAPGCAGEAMQHVYLEGEISEFTTELNATLSSLQSYIAKFPSSELGLSLTAAWRGCMKDKGYSYTDQDDAGAGFSDRLTVEADELAVRSADLDCDKKVGLTEARSDFERARLSEWMSDNETLVSHMDAGIVDFRSRVALLQEDMSP